LTISDLVTMGIEDDLALEDPIEVGDVKDIPRMPIL
jgi:hypothetical protein